MAQIPELPGTVIPELPTGGPVDADQADAEAFRATAGSFRRGFRSGMHSVGAMLSNLIGQSAESVGLTAFAEDRFADAKRFTDFSEAVGPNVRDYGQVKDFNDIMDFVAGHAGSGVATSVPVLGVALGLRRPIGGVVAGAGALEAGEQVGTLRADPNVRREDILGNALVKGAIGGAMETVAGATGRAAKLATRTSLRRPIDVPKEFVRGTVGEGITEAGQDLVGQQLHRSLNPAVSIDPEQTLNSALAGAAGGGTITTAAAAAGSLPTIIEGATEAAKKLPGKVREYANTADELRVRLGKKVAPPDPDGIPEEAFDPSVPVERVMEMLEGAENKFGEYWQKVKDRPEFKKAAEAIKDFDLTDPGKRTEAFKRVKEAFDFAEHGNKVKSAVNKLRERFSGKKQSLMDPTKFPTELGTRVLAREPITLGGRDKRSADFLVQNGYREEQPGVWVPSSKRSEQRTKVDTYIAQQLSERFLPQAVRDSSNDDDVLELAGYIKQMALNPETAAETATARTLLRAFAEPDGNDEETTLHSKAKRKLIDLMDIAIDRVYSSEESRKWAKGVIRASVRQDDELQGHRLRRVKEILEGNMISKYTLDEKLMNAATGQLAGPLLDLMESGLPSEGLGYGGKSEEVREKGRAGRASQQQTDLLDGLREVVGERLDLVIEELDAVRPERPVTSTDVFLESERDAGEDVEASKTPASAMAEDPRADVRVGVPLPTEKARQTLAQMRQEYRQRDVTLTAKPVEGRDGFHTIEMEATDQMGLSKEQIERIKERVTEEEQAQGVKVYNRSELKDGVLTVRTKAHPAGVKINLVKLFIEMVRSEGQKTSEVGAKYVSDLVHRGLAALVASEEFKSFKTELKKDADGNWDLPNSALVAVYGGKRWYWGNVKSTDFGMSKTARNLRAKAREAFKLYGEPDFKQVKRKDGTIAGIPQNQTAAAYQELGRYYDAVRDIEERVSDMEKDAMIDLADEGPDALDSALVPMRVALGKAKVEDEVTRLESAIGRVEREAERMRMQEGDDEHAGAVRDTSEIAERQARMNLPRGALEEDTGRPIGEGRPKVTSERRVNIVPAEEGERADQKHGPVTQVNYKEREQSLNKRAAEIDRLLPKAKGKELKELKAQREEVSRRLEVLRASKESVTKALGKPSTANAQTPAFPELKNKNLPEPNAVPNDRRYAARHPQLELPLAKTGAVGLSKLEAEMNEASRELHRNLVSGAMGNYDEQTKVGRELAAELEEQLKKKGVKFSAMNIGRDEEAVTEAQKKEVTAYVEKVLGKDKAKVLFEKMAAAGEFAEVDGVDMLKISVDALDPMGVGKHEAVHAFIRRLIKADRKAAQTLMRAASAAPVVARLRELLKGHPRAIEQLSDPEERLAYAYQFWDSVKGLFTVGPETNSWFTKIRKAFKKVFAFWAEELNEAEDAQRAGEIIEAFHNGAFADKSAVAQVLAERFPERRGIDKMWPKLGELMNKFVWTAQGAVRDMNLAPLNEVMDDFHTTVGTSGEGPGWLQAKHAEFNRRLNRVTRALRGMTEEQQQVVLREMRSGQDRTSDAAKELESVLKEAFQYMSGSGVKAVTGYNSAGVPQYRDMREITKNYFPQVFDVDYVRTHKDEFIALLVKHGFDNTEQMWRKMTEGSTESNPREDAVLGVTLFAPQVNERVLTNIPADELAPFLRNDLFGIMSDYLARAARRAEYTKRFGNSGEIITEAVKQAKQLGMTEAQERTFNEVVRAMEGTLGANMSREMRQVFGAITTYQNIRLLPLALFSSIVDPLGIAVRGGTLEEAFQGFWRGIKDLRSAWGGKATEDDAYQLAQTIGAINIANDAAVVGDMYSSQFMPAFQRNLNEKFFKYNGMESWNRSMRVAAAAAAEQFIIRHATRPNENSERFLRELGLEPGDVAVQDGKLVLNQKTQKALNMWVDQAIIRPNAALRPVYMSDPNWILISHLKQFTYLFQKVIMARVYHEAMHGNYSPAWTLAGYVPMIIASDMMRIALTPGTGDDNSKAGWNAFDWIGRGVQRAALFGPGQFALDAGMDLEAGRTGIEALAGPSAQQLMDFVRESRPDGDLTRTVMQAVPGARYFQ